MIHEEAIDLDTLIWIMKCIKHNLAYTNLGSTLQYLNQSDLDLLGRIQERYGHKTMEGTLYYLEKLVDDPTDDEARALVRWVNNEDEWEAMCRAVKILIRDPNDQAMLLTQAVMMAGIVPRRST